MKNDNKNITISNIEEALNCVFNIPEIKTLKSVVNSIFSAVNKWLNSPEAQNIIRGLDEFQKVNVISEHGWCVCDEELKNKISSKPKITQDEIDELITSYYSVNSYQILKEKLQVWEKVPFLQERMPIIKSCLYASEKIDGEYLFNMAIPTLLAQEDGIFEEIYNLIPDESKKEISDKDSLKDNQIKDIIIGYLWYNGYGPFAAYAMKVLVQKTFLDGRNKKYGIPSLSAEELKKYDKFRNRILHGHKDYLKYGTLKSYIQSWFELELLFLIYAAVLDITKGRS